MSRLKFFLILIFIIIGIAAYGYFKAIPSIENQTADLPKIEITPKYFNFGEAEYGQILTHSFLVKNTGKAVLEIKRIATSCPCTTAEIEKEKINPGEEAELLVKYDTGAMSGPHGRGEQERIIYVKSNDPINPQVEVTIKAYVR